MDYSEPRKRRRLWPAVLPLASVVLLAVIWSGFWFYAASTAETAIAGWQAREAKTGRHYACGRESISGFPFRIEFRCAGAQIAFSRFHPALALQLSDILVAAQVYQPTLLISEFSAPLTIGEQGQAPTHAASWTLARASVRGQPASPQRMSIAVDGLHVDRLDEGARVPFASAKHLELHGRLAEGSVASNPVIEVALQLAEGTAPGLHALADQPIEAAVVGVLRGLKDFAPKPWADRFRELQANDGRIEITQTRVQQGDTIAVGAGTLGLSAQGYPEGELNLTVAGLEKFLQRLGLDRAPPKGSTLDRVGSALDRISPGLGSLAREHAGSTIIAGLGLAGQQTVLEGQRAYRLPLRFADGQVMLGPIPLGRVKPLF